MASAYHPVPAFLGTAETGYGIVVRLINHIDHLLKNLIILDVIRFFDLMSLLSLILIIAGAPSSTH